MGKPMNEVSNICRPMRITRTIICHCFNLLLLHLVHLFYFRTLVAPTSLALLHQSWRSIIPTTISSVLSLTVLPVILVRHFKPLQLQSSPTPLASSLHQPRSVPTALLMMPPVRWKRQLSSMVSSYSIQQRVYLTHPRFPIEPKSSWNSWWEIGHQGLCWKLMELQFHCVYGEIYIVGPAQGHGKGSRINGRNTSLL